MADEILVMAGGYPQLHFHGFQETITPFYEQADLQVVGATVATGLRTRIVESFVYGVPVLSTVIGAEGLGSLKTGFNIFLAKDSESFVAQITNIIENPELLSEIALNAQQTYNRYHRRQVVANRLSELLAQHIIR